ncbi:MAG TPA: thiamine pyrophosphate-binding protein, partial [Pyrinomonadaceae bacterium]|nr:thiamine pyrophosphate-binding protein [Pyrinomonadaceae bacterium]
MHEQVEARKLPWLHGGDLIVQQLAALKVKHLFTLTGGHISSLYDAARFTDISIVDFRHEQAAVHAADAYARIKRDVAVAALTAGPGVTGGLTGIANAYYAESPVLTLGGRNPFPTDGAGNLQEAPHLEIMRPVTKYCAAIYDYWRSREVIFEAFVTARARRTGPAYVDVPVNVQFTQLRPEEAPPLREFPTWNRPAADQESIRRVAELLGAAKQPIIVAGTGAYWDHAEEVLGEFASTLKAPVYLNGMARGLLGRDHLYQV